MKGNLFKDTRKQSCGYEPKEYSRYERQKKNRNEYKSNLIKIFECDNEAKFYQYKKYLTKLILDEYHYYDSSIITIDWVLGKVFDNKSYNCFYYIMTLFNENKKSPKKYIPEDFKQTYKERHILEMRTKKIQKLKENFKK